MTLTFTQCLAMSLLAGVGLSVGSYSSAQLWGILYQSCIQLIAILQKSQAVMIDGRPHCRHCLNALPFLEGPPSDLTKGPPSE